MVVAVRYAAISETITVSGTATSYTYYEGTSLPGTFTYVSGTSYYSYSAIRNCESYDSTTISGNSITIVHSKSWCTTNTVTVTYTVKYTNNTEMPWTSGKASSSITENGMSYISSASASVDKTTVLPGETATLTLVIKANFVSSLSTQTVVGTYSYEFLNVTRYVYFTFTYD